MSAERNRARPVGRSIPVACLLVVSLLAGCESTVVPSGTPGPTTAPTSTPSASAEPSATATPAMTPTPGAVALEPGALAVTVADRLRVRSEPRVSDDSIMYTPVLPVGTDLVVLDGPVEDSGYTWYRVAPTTVTLNGAEDGWVAVADHDGTPWVALSEGAPSGIELASADVSRAPTTMKDAKRAGAAINAFAFELYRRMLADPTLDLKGRNVVFSPTSIEIALAMARAGARGATAAEMDAVLHADGWGGLASGLNALDQWLSSLRASWEDEEGNPQQLSLNLANAAFAQRDYHLEPAYLDAIAQAMGAGVGLTDFAADPEAARQAINAWVARQTMNRIMEVLSPPDVTSDTRLMLVNAIYLKAGWAQRFDEDETSDRAFTTTAGKRIEVPTMSLSGGQGVPYASGAGWRATELRYEGAGVTTPLAMTLILPDDMAAFEKGLTSAKVDKVVAKLDAGRKEQEDAFTCPPPNPEGMCTCYPYQVHLFMPRFGIDTRALLPAALVALGMPKAMDAAQADFSGMTGARDLYIGSVIHQANIDVDEKGTEAAAVTIVGMDTTGGCGPASPLKTITLRLNKPFLFVLRDLKTGAILFMGRVLDPSTRR